MKLQYASPWFRAYYGPGQHYGYSSGQPYEPLRRARPFCVLPVEPLLIYELVGRGALCVLRSAHLRYLITIRQAQRSTRNPSNVVKRLLSWH